MRSTLFKPVAWFWGAAIDSASIGIDSRITLRPTQEERRTQGKNDRLAVEVSLDAYTLCIGGKGEREAIAKNRGIRPVLPLADHWPEHFGLEEESCSVGPVPRRNSENSSALGEEVCLDPREWTRASDAGGARIAKLIPDASVQSSRPVAAFHLPSGEHGG
jgi:hypothetical protein